jgi:hypothetical protein
MTEEIKKKRGAPRGNQNARKHGFYSPLLDDEEQRDFFQATMVEGIDEEIALLRVKLKSVVRHDPDNIKLIMQASESLARLLLAKYNLGKSDKKSLKNAIGNVLREIALPLGISADIGKLIAK